MELNKKFILSIFALLLVVFVISCKPGTAGIIPSKDVKTDTKISEFETTQQVKKFSSVQEIRDFLDKSAAGSYSGGFGSGGIKRAFAGDVMMAESAAPSAAKSAEAAGSSAADYSTTNIQVEGVDEADFVKNDGKYIYVLSQDNFVIVDAYPADKAQILSKIKLDGRPRDMFVSKDRVVIFEEDDGEVYAISEYDFVPRPRYTTQTHIVVYDVSDKKNPKKVKDYHLNGNYYQSRMIGDYVYFIVQEGVYYYDRIIDLPIIKESSRTVVKPDIYYFDNPEASYNFNTVASFNMFEDEDKIEAKTFMMGYTNTLYVSQDSIYITYQKNLPYRYYESYNEERFYKVVLPLLQPDAKSQIGSIRNENDLTPYERWDKISAVLEEMYNKMDENAKEELIGKIEEAVAEYEAEQEQERRKTVIHKIKINNGEIDYDKRGEVPGYLLNQFSLDEHEGNLRVATTVEFYGIIPIMAKEASAGSIAGSSGAAQASEAKASSARILPPRPMPERKNVMYNNVYVLNSKLEIIGKLEELASDERMYSTRFIGDRLYMVTFKRIDPLFVIDLSDPEKPEVLGELKIPGFSDYLHPYDENHIIGIGKETGSNDWGGISVKGLKIALFDVSDVKNPKQVDNYEIGEAGTDSEALRDHKAFLFDKKKDILVIPVTEVKGKEYYDPRLGYYRQRIWQGAYVFSLTPQEGFKVKGKISHNEGDEEKGYYYYGSPNSVRRALYMDDVLYTISAAKIEMNDISTVEKINEVELPYEKIKYYDYPWY